MEKPVEIVEKCEFSTAIPGISNSANPETRLYNPVNKRLREKNNKIMSPLKQGNYRAFFWEKVGKLPKDTIGNRGGSDCGQKILWKFNKLAKGMFFLPREILKKNLEPQGVGPR